jgi:integrase
MAAEAILPSRACEINLAAIELAAFYARERARVASLSCSWEQVADLLPIGAGDWISSEARPGRLSPKLLDEFAEIVGTAESPDSDGEDALNAHEFEQLIAAIRKRRGTIGGAPVSVWWCAFLLTLVDTGLGPRALLLLSREAFDPATKSLQWRSFQLRLQPKTAAAITVLTANTNPKASPHLFPWSGSKAALTNRFRRLLESASVPKLPGQLFRTLCVPPKRVPHLLAQVEPISESEVGQLLEERSIRRGSEPIVVRLSSYSPRAMRVFFQAVYRPECLGRRGKEFVKHHSNAIDTLSNFCACDVLLDQLSDGLLGDFGCWLRLRRSTKTVNDYVRTLRRMWAHAHASGLTTTGPRPRRQPWAQSRSGGRKTRSPDKTPVVLISNNGPRTLRAFFDSTYWPRRESFCKASAKYDYTAVINNLNAYCACEVTLDQLSDDLLERFAAFRLKAGRAIPTVNKDLVVLAALWRYAFRKRKVDDQPRDVEKIRELKRLPEAWSLQQFGKILDAAATEPGTTTICDAPASLFWPALLLTLYDTGLRVSALLSLSIHNLDGQRGWLTVPAEVQKQKASQAFPLDTRTLELLLRLPRETDRLFPVPWKDPLPNLQRWYRTILQRAGLPSGKRDLFQKIRRTNATQTAVSGGEDAAQKQLGHSSLSLTRRNYIDPRFLDRTQLVEIERPNWSGQAGLTAPLPPLIPATGTPITAEHRRAPGQSHRGFTNPLSKAVGQ